MPFTIHREAPKVKLITLGQADKEIEMGKEPVADYYPPGATEPIVRPDNVPEPAANAEVEEPADKPAKDEPQKAAKPNGKKK